MLIKKLDSKLDHLGMIVSILCAVHCALLPLAITVLPLVGLEFLERPATELVVISLSLIIGLISMSRAWRSHHSALPSVIIFLGFTIIFSGHFLAAKCWEWLFVTLGGGVVVTAHYYNWRLLCRANKGCHIEHKQ